MGIDRGMGAPAPKKASRPLTVADRAEPKPLQRGYAGRRPKAPPAPAVPQPPTGNPFGRYDLGYSPGAPIGGGGAPAPVVSDADWIKNGGDSAYSAQLAALNAALQQQLADLTHQQSDYETSYGDSLKALGWQQAVVDNPDTPDVNESVPGQWLVDDLNTAAGRAVNNQRNDFASRGLLQSSLFAQANDDLMRSLNDQLSGVNKGRQSFLDDITRQQASAKTANQTAIQQAQAEALLRRAAGVTL